MRWSDYGKGRRRTGPSNDEIRKISRKNEELSYIFRMYLIVAAVSALYFWIVYSNSDGSFLPAIMVVLAFFPGTPIVSFIVYYGESERYEIKKKYGDTSIDRSKAAAWIVLFSFGAFWFGVGKSDILAESRKASNSTPSATRNSPTFNEGTLRKAAEELFDRCTAYPSGAGCRERGF